MEFLSRVSHFQRFSQPENHATNNTLLVLRRFYDSSPNKIQRVLTSLLETELSNGASSSRHLSARASCFFAKAHRRKKAITEQTTITGIRISTRSSKEMTAKVRVAT
jgi:hypothetical protein